MTRTSRGPIPNSRASLHWRHTFRCPEGIFRPWPKGGRVTSERAAPIFQGMRNIILARTSPALPSGVSMAEIGALVGDPARANMLTALMNGESLTASDLAWHAGVTPQTASGHLARMTEAELIKVMAQGRHRYYKLASPRVAQMLESIFLVAADQTM